MKLSIRCHPCVPVSADELEPWLVQQAADLRAEVPHATVRLSRLTQGRASADLDVGWLIEMDLSEDESAQARERISEALRDMRLLGLAPTVFAPTAVAS